ncbi:MAG: hypothetical protein U5P41_10655 [Gammaproteobacteria bacterium]|nr:hypothetical protein [Gammaproteobacteria bacterium]
MPAVKHPFTDLVVRCVLVALGTGTATALLLVLTVLLLSAGYTESSPPAWP